MNYELFEILEKPVDSLKRKTLKLSSKTKLKTCTMKSDKPKFNFRL